MTKMRVYQEVRKMRFEELYELRTQKRLTVKEAAEILGVHERTFRRWTNRFYDMYRFKHEGTRSYSWVKRTLQDAELAKKSKKQGGHRRKRDRHPAKGMMIHQDGFTHEWIEDNIWDLIVTMDYAGNIYVAKLNLYAKTQNTISPVFD